MRSDSQDGVMRDLFGQVVAPVKVFQSQEKKGVQVTPSVTSGQSGSGSSKSVALQQSLANRLRERLGSGGLMQSQQILSLKTTPSRRQFCQDLLSEPITNGNGSGSWPTPQTMDGARCNQIRSQEELKEARKNGGCSNLRESVHTWPTPRTTDGEGGPRPLNEKGQRISKTNPNLTFGANLADMARLSTTCPTPSARDYKSGYEGGRLRNGKVSTDTLDVATQLTGKQLSGSNVKTEKRVRYRLNPKFSLWLMGYPRSWIERAIPTNGRTQIRLPV